MLTPRLCREGLLLAVRQWAQNVVNDVRRRVRARPIGSPVRRQSPLGRCWRPICRSPPTRGASRPSLFLEPPQVSSCRVVVAPRYRDPDSLRPMDSISALAEGRVRNRLFMRALDVRFRALREGARCLRGGGCSQLSAPSFLAGTSGWGSWRGAGAGRRARTLRWCLVGQRAFGRS